jgi:hypothetical protein
MTRRVMPAIVLVPLLVVALVVSSSACGTMANFNGGAILGPPKDADRPLPYGGVLWDVEALANADGVVSPEGIALLPVWLIEVGLSATLDTATLPVVAWVQIRRALESPTPQEQPPVSGPLVRPRE